MPITMSSIEEPYLRSLFLYHSSDNNMLGKWTTVTVLLLLCWPQLFCGWDHFIICWTNAVCKQPEKVGQMFPVSFQRNRKQCKSQMYDNRGVTNNGHVLCCAQICQEQTWKQYALSLLLMWATIWSEFLVSQRNLSCYLFGPTNFPEIEISCKYGRRILRS